MKIKSDSMYKLIGIGLFVYMLGILGQSSYMNYKVNKQVTNLRDSIESLEKENKQIAQDIEYYKTESYKEKVARQRLGLKKPNEEVMVVVPEENKEKIEEKPNYPNYVKWWRFVSGKTAKEL